MAGLLPLSRLFWAVTIGRYWAVYHINRVVTVLSRPGEHILDKAFALHLRFPCLVFALLGFLRGDSLLLLFSNTVTVFDAAHLIDGRGIAIIKAAFLLCTHITDVLHAVFNNRAASLIPCALVGEIKRPVCHSVYNLAKRPGYDERGYTNQEHNKPFKMIRHRIDAIEQRRCFNQNDGDLQYP